MPKEFIKPFWDYLLKILARVNIKCLGWSEKGSPDSTKWNQRHELKVKSHWKIGEKEFTIANELQNFWQRRV